MEHFPTLPVEEEGRLCDPILRENFIERIFVLRRWKDRVLADPRPARLVEFHTAHKLLVMAHHPRAVGALGRIVAGPKGDTSLKDRVTAYEKALLEALALRATVAKHVNVLQHTMGYFRHELSADEKQELAEVIEQYRQERVPLIVPVTLLRHYIRKYGSDYLAGQVYFNPHPAELRLRNHV